MASVNLVYSMGNSVQCLYGDLKGWMREAVGGRSMVREKKKYACLAESLCCKARRQCNVVKQLYPLQE